MGRGESFGKKFGKLIRPAAAALMLAGTPATETKAVSDVVIDGFRTEIPDSLVRDMEKRGESAEDFVRFCGHLYIPAIFDGPLRERMSVIDERWRGVICYAYGLAALEAGEKVREVQPGEAAGHLFTYKHRAIEILRLMNVDEGLLTYLEQTIPEK